MKRFDPVTQARIDLTAALRSAARMGLNEGVCNHFSLVMPGDPGKFLINPQGLHWSEITPADLMIVDAKGVVVEGKHTVEPTAFFIHGRIHLGKRKKCVLHTHMPFATALTLLDGGELDVFANQNAMRYYGRIGYDREYGGVALDNAEGDRICNALGDNEVVFMQHHGVIVCGDNVAYAFDDLYYLERSCMVQVLAQGTGGKLKRVPEKMVAEAARQIGGERQQSVLHFEALKRLLDRGEPGWSRLNWSIRRFMVFAPNRETTGAVETMALYAGQSAGLVREQKPAGKIVAELMRQATELINDLSGRGR